MLRKKMILLSIAVLLLAACSTIARSEGGSLATNNPAGVVPEICPTTQPAEPAFIPPQPYPAQPPFEGMFWYGSPSLWTLLPQDGVWQGLPYDDVHGYTQKVFFWREGYDPSSEPQPALTLRGERLDVEGEAFETDEATNAMGTDIGSAMLVGANIPGTGCWQLTASYGAQELSFTLQVRP